MVLLHLGHRLVQMCLRLLRAELWSGATAVGQQRRLSRVTARVVPGDVLRTPAVAGHIRVVVTGTEGTRLHEEVVVAGGTIEAGRLVRTTEEDLKSWLTAASEELPPAQVRDRLTELWPGLSQPLSGILANRAGARRRSLATLIESRCTEEVAAMNTHPGRAGALHPRRAGRHPVLGAGQPVRDRGGTRPAPQGSRRIEAAAGLHSGDARAGDGGAATPLRRPASPLVPRRHHLPGACLHSARWERMMAPVRRAPPNPPRRWASRAAEAKPGRPGRASQTTVRRATPCRMGRAAPGGRPFHRDPSAHRGVPAGPGHGAQ